MNNAIKDPRGRIKRHGNIWCLENVLIEEVFSNNSGTGFVVVSYVENGENNNTYIELLRLNVDKGTIIMNQSDHHVVPLQGLSPGTWIDADFSPNMTKSIPPQTRAFRILVRSVPKNPAVRPKPPQYKPTPKTPPFGNAPPENPRTPIRNSKITTGNVVDVDLFSNIITTGIKDNINEQFKFVVTNRTEILNSSGMTIPLHKIIPGQLVRVTHSNIQTLSLPPQSAAYKIQVVKQVKTS